MYSESFEGETTKLLDSYSFGALVYEINSKRYLFIGKSFENIYYQDAIQRRRQEHAKLIPKTYKDLI